MDLNDPMLEHLIEKITDALNNNDYEEAAKYMDIVIEKYPEVADVLMHSIEFSNMMAENEEELIKEAENMPFEDSSIVNSDYDPTKTNEFNESDVEINENNLENHPNEQEILEDMNTLLQMEPETLDEYIQKGTILTITENFEEALACFEKALEMDPENISALIAKASVFEIMEKEEEAEKLYEIIMNADTNDIHDIMSKGFILETHQRFEEALNCYNTALEENPDDLNVLFLKGGCLLANGNYEESLDYLNKVINSFEEELEPQLMFELATAQHNKGIVLDKLNKQDEALKSFNIGLKHNPNYFPSYYEIGLIEEERKNYNDALSNFNKFLEFDEENLEVIEAKERVEKLLE